MGTGTGLVLKISMFPAVRPEPVPISSQALSNEDPRLARADWRNCGEDQWTQSCRSGRLPAGTA